MSNKLVLRVNGQDYGGWKTVRVTHGVEAVCGSFELSVSERWNGQKTPWPITEEDICTVLVNDVPLISGFVDTRSHSYSAREHTLSVTGRDAASALVDNSAVLKRWEYAKLPSILVLAKKLADPFGVPVALDSGVKLLAAPPDKFSIDPGETCFEILDRACKLVGVLPISNGLGGVLLTRAGTAGSGSDLVEGVNILSASATYDATGRFGTYIVTGQKRGTDDNFGLGVAAIKGTANDFSVRRTNRVLMVRSEGALTPKLAKVRAQWEAAVRMGRSASFTVTVQDWVQPGGDLWRANQLVNVRSPLLGVDGALLITQVQMTLGPEGTLTELTLKPPEAYLPQPTIGKNDAVWREISHGV